MHGVCQLTAANSPKSFLSFIILFHPRFLFSTSWCTRQSDFLDTIFDHLCRLRINRFVYCQRLSSFLCLKWLKEEINATLSSSIQFQISSLTVSLLLCLPYKVTHCHNLSSLYKLTPLHPSLQSVMKLSVAARSTGPVKAAPTAEMLKNRHLSGWLWREAFMD